MEPRTPEHAQGADAKNGQECWGCRWLGEACMGGGAFGGAGVVRAWLVVGAVVVVVGCPSGP